MAAIAHASRVNTTNQTTTSTSFVDATNGDIGSGNFSNGKKYLILAAAQLGNSSTTISVSLRVVHGSTAFADSEQDLGVSVANDRKPYFWWTVWTAVTGEDINFQYQADSGATAALNFIVLLAINLSDDVAENTDWFYDERSTDDSLTTTPLAGGSITFTPSAAGSDWLVLTNAQFTCATNTRSAMSQITRSGEASSTIPNIAYEYPIANGLNVLSMARSFNLGAASNTFAESASESFADVTRLHSRVFTINLDKFRNHVVEYTEAAVTLSATDFATLFESLTITPDVTGDVWVGAYTGIDQQAAALNFQFRIQQDEVDEPAGQTAANYPFDGGQDITDVAPFFTQCVPSLTGTTAYTFDFDGSANATTNTPVALHRSLWAVSMELPGTAQSVVPVVAGQYRQRMV